MTNETAHCLPKYWTKFECINTNKCNVTYFVNKYIKTFKDFDKVKYISFQNMVLII